jgi:Head domain of trimeric autotransporter adhesin
MNIHTWKLRAVLILAVGLVIPLQLHAQTTFTIPFTASQTSPALSLNIDSYGSLLETAPLNSSVSLTLASGSQMLWIPALGAFRAGYFSGSQWTLANIGAYSVAMGYNTTASGAGSVAIGDGHFVNCQWQRSNGDWH